MEIQFREGIFSWGYLLWLSFFSFTCKTWFQIFTIIKPIQVLTKNQSSWTLSSFLTLKLKEIFTVNSKCSTYPPTHLPFPSCEPSSITPVNLKLITNSLVSRLREILTATGKPDERLTDQEVSWWPPAKSLSSDSVGFEPSFPPSLV